MTQKLIIVESKLGTKQRVTGIHFMPYDPEKGLSQDMIDKNILVDEVLQPENNGQIPAHFINPQTGEQWYEYSERPLTTEEKLVEAENKIILMQQALDELLLGGM